MALNNEDKKDVAKHMGKALANKVSKVTKDSYLNRERKVNADYMRKAGYGDELAKRKSIHRKYEGLRNK